MEKRVSWNKRKIDMRARSCRVHHKYGNGRCIIKSGRIGIESILKCYKIRRTKK